MTATFRTLLLVLSLIIVSNANATNIVVGTQHSLKSPILNETRQLQIYLPDSYESSNKQYPVLYVIDGQRYFLHAIAHQQTLRFQDKTPELIVVGLTTDNRKRRQWLSPNKHLFMNFLAQELIPWVNQNYRTSKERLYFGWEMAAGLVPDLITEHPALFQAFFMASPTHINRQRIDNITHYLKAPINKHYVYATLGEVEIWSTASMAALEKAVTAAPAQSITWNYDLEADHDHYTTPLVTIDKGLLGYFSNYGPLRFYSIKEFESFGGLPALKRHYETRGQRFGISTEIHNDTKHYLLNQSLKENNLKLFAELEESFKGFVASYYRVDFWFERIANAYMQLNNHGKAQKVLEIGIGKLPNSHKLHATLAKLHKQQNKIELARESYLKAIALASNNKALTDTYQAELSLLSDK